MAPIADGEDDLTPARTRELLDAGEIELIDVREDHEWEGGHIPGARHIPVAKLSEEAASIPQDKPVVFQCFSGGRSGQATQAFKASGYDAHNMEGGISEWAAEGLPMEGEVVKP